MGQEKEKKQFGEKTSRLFCSLLIFLITGAIIYPADKAWSDMNENEKLEYLYGKVRGDNVVFDTEKSNYDDINGTFSTNVSIGRNNKPLVHIGSDSQKKPGTSRVLIGYNNKAAHNGVTIGDSNYTYGSQSIAMGYQSTSYGHDGIAIGMGAKALTSTEVKNLGYGSRDFQARNVAVGENTVAGAYSAAYGPSSASIGKFSTAIGLQAVAGGENADYFAGALSSVKSKAKESISDEEVKEKYKDYLTNINLANFSEYEQGNIIDELRVTMFLEKTPALGATAIGSLSRAKKDYSVALGTASIADRESFTSEKIAPYSEFNLNGKTLGAVSVGGNGYLRQIINLADATEDTDAVNLRQLKAAVKNSNSGAGASSLNFHGDKNTSGSVNLSTENLTIAGTEDEITTKAEGNKLTVALDKKITDKLDGIGTGNVAKGDTNTVTGDTVFNAIENKLNNNTIANALEKGNINSNTLKVMGGEEKVLGKDVSIELKEKSIKKSHLSEDITETLDKVGDGVIAKDGEKSDHTVTGKTVYEYLEKNGMATDQILKNTNEIRQTKSEVRHVGALSSALAALHPMQYDPLQKNQIMAGIGTYRDKQAVAVGLTHYFNENLMMTAGVSVGEEQRVKTMANVGFTWKIGKDEDRKDLPERYKEGPISSIYKMQQEMEEVLTENKILKEKMQKLEKQIEMLMNK